MLNASTTQELDAIDILEVADLATSSSPLAVSWETPVDAFFHPGGRMRPFGEVTIELRPAPEPTLMVRLRERRRRFGVLVGALLIMPLGILLGAAIVSLLPAERAATTASTNAATTAPAVTVAAPTPGPTTPPPAVEAAKPTSGTLLVPAKQKVTLDGKRLDTTSAIVACGKHTVRVGWAKPKTVDVPCGGEIAVR